MRERYFRLVTRDKMTSDLRRMIGDEYRPKIVTPIRTRLAYGAISLEESPMDDSEIQTREYRLKEIIPAEIFVYEED
jgi:hypothetical protein